ncbi:MAG: hypothetical protein WBF53_00985 [Litorimonas sp.]
MIRTGLIATLAASMAALLFAVSPVGEAEAQTPAPAPLTDAAALGDRAPARNIDTPFEDRRLTNACIEAGLSKADCLCVTKVLKYELTLSEYRDAVRRHTTGPVLINASTRGRARTQPDPALQTLIGGADFDQRCVAADRHFARSQPF